MSINRPFNWRPYAFLAPALTVIAVFLLWPLFELAGLSFASWNGYSRIHFVGFRTWTSLFADERFHDALRNTLVWTLASCIVPVAMGCVLAIGIWHAGRWFGRLGLVIAVIPVLLPATVAATTFGIIYNPLYGPLDGSLQLLGFGTNLPVWLGDPAFAFWAVFAISAWNAAGFTALILVVTMRTIDPTYFDLSRAEGAGFLGQLRHVLFPACRRSLAFAVVVTVVITSQVEDMLLALNTNGGPDNSTLMLPLDMYFRAFSGLGNVGQAAAEAWIQIAIVAAVAGLALLATRGGSGMAGGEGSTGAGFNPLAALVVLVMAVVTLLPLWWDVVASMTTGQSIVLKPLNFVISNPSLSSYAAVWSEGLGMGLWESLAIGMVVVVGVLVLGIPAALGLTLMRNGIVRGIVLVALVFTLLQPGDTFVITLHYWLLRLHLLNTVAGLIIAEGSRELPFAILLIWLAIISLPRDVLTAAEMDVGQGFTLLTRVVLPLAAPAAGFAALWVFVTSWSEYALPYQLMSNGTIETAPMALDRLAGTSDTQFGLLGAGTMLLILPTLLGLALVAAPIARWARSATRVLTG